MGLAIYKPGQGYWTRVMTAIAAAVLVLAGVGWMWQQLSAVGYSGGGVNRERLELTPRIKAWGQANANPVAALDELRRIETTEPPAGELPQFKLTSASGATYTLTAEQLRQAANYQAPGLTGVPENTTIQGPPLAAEVRGENISFSVGADAIGRSRMYIQAAVAAGIVLGFGLLILWLLNRPRIVDFMIATEAEMKKVNWPSRREIVGSTWLVICGTFLMAFILFVVDLVFASFFSAIGVLKGYNLFG